MGEVVRGLKGCSLEEMVGVNGLYGGGGMENMGVFMEGKEGRVKVC